MKKIISVTLAALLLVGCFVIAVSAESESVKIRIEGMSSTLFNGEVPLGESKNVEDVMRALGESEEGLDIVFTNSDYGAYIGSINDDVEVTVSVADPGDNENFTNYYIGWMFAVDGKVSSVGASQYELSGGEEIVFCYCDMNCQFPVADFSEEGKIKFTSYGWLPDWSGMDWLPVTDATVKLNDREFVTDENGVVEYNPADFEGFVKVQIAKNDEEDYPLVCRFEDGFGFTPQQATSPSDATTAPTEATTAPTEATTVPTEATTAPQATTPPATVAPATDAAQTPTSAVSSEKVENTIKVKTKKVTVKSGKSVKAAKAFTVKKAVGKVTYRKVKGSKRITVKSNGTIVVKKGLRKGTYTIKVKVTAKGNDTTKAGSKTVKVKITVK